MCSVVFYGDLGRNLAQEVCTHCFSQLMLFIGNTALERGTIEELGMAVGADLDTGFEGMVRPGKLVTELRWWRRGLHMAGDAGIYERCVWRTDTFGEVGVLAHQHITLGGGMGCGIARNGDVITMNCVP